MMGEPRGPRGPRGPKPQLKNMKGTLIRLWKFLFDAYGKQLLVVAVLILLSSLAGVASSLFMKDLIDQYILPQIGQDAPDFAPLLRVIVLMACIYLAGAGSTYLYGRMMIFISQGTLLKMRKTLFSHMQGLPIKYFDTHAHGNIMSVYTNDIDTLRQMISQSLPQLLSSLVTVISVFFTMISLSLPLTGVMLVMVFLILQVTGKVAGQSGKFFLSQQKNLGAVNGYIEEMMEGQKVVKVFCHEDECIRNFNQLNDALYESSRQANGFVNILGPINNNLGHLSYVVIAIVGSLLAINSVWGFSLGGLAAFLQLNRNFIMPISQISQQMNSVVMALAGAERVFEMMDEPLEEDEGYVELVNAKRLADGSLTETPERTGLWAWKHPHKDGTLTYTQLKGDVVLDGVDFGYTDEKIVLHDIKLYARPGQKIAFVGAPGAGKTTITNLINRFYDIQDGKIRYDGINITKIKKPDLRRSLGIVLQDTNLFTGTVMENIRYGRLDATDKECMAAAQLAGADSFIQLLPQGYDTLLTGNGANLSQGQRQLLAIARAAVADPPV
ncbi:MAG: ABC transporter ATP-binding protein, partial [Clostridia bacterium]|nr:ABC transporter ATP-binding protein [Clostridia bacterium]